MMNAISSSAGRSIASWSAFASRSSRSQSPISSQELGTITFPNSGAAAAQAAFIEGVKDLHSFQFDEAAVAFQRAQKADPAFAMAYWGEAMSHNHPLWAQQDDKAAKAILEKIAPTSEARQAKAKLPKEKAFLKAIDVLYYAPGDKLARDIAYSDATGGDVCAVAGRSRGRDVVRAVAARHRAPDRQGLPAPGARRIDRGESVQGKPEAPGRGALHHSRVRRSRSRAAGADRGARRTRASRRPRRTRSICRRTSSCSAACGKTSASRTSSPTSRRPSSTRA